MVQGIFPVERSDLKQIDKLIDDFKEFFLPKEWIWRKGQREAIKEIVKTYINKTHEVVVLEAPVGSGKSIIAMCVSFILNSIKKSGYILTSDISLQEQYERDFKNFKLNWGSIKGIDNYICTDNDEKNSIGTCRICNKSPQSMYCYKDCPYFSARDKAALSPTSILNYSYWLIMMNYVFSNRDENEEVKILFQPRDFVICDEAHKIVDIVQNHFSPKFDEFTIDKIKKLTTFYDVYKVADHRDQLKRLTSNIKKLYKEENQEQLLNILKSIEIDLENYRPSYELLKNKIKEYSLKNKVDKQWKDAVKLADWLKDLHCKIEDYVTIISKTSSRNLIKNPQGEETIVFNCLQEYYLMNNHFNKWNKFTVLMSATISEPSQYLKGMAISNAKFIKMESLFDFKKSPIYYIPGHKMSFKELNNTLPWLYKKIDSILLDHKNESGIIHSVSYDLALKIFTNVSKESQKRLLVYNGIDEKRDVLETLKREKNKVVIGPSLLEGLNLKDDWSRFQIFAKVPYLAITDKFVEAKMKLNPSWYQWKAILNILQGVGRSIRSENDYAITYILDGCFGDLIHYNRKAFPLEFIQRIIVKNE